MQKHKKFFSALPPMPTKTKFQKLSEKRNCETVKKFNYDYWNRKYKKNLNYFE